MERSDDLAAEARRLGRLEAECFVAGLCAVERRERDDRLTRLAAGAAPDGARDGWPGVSSGEIGRLRLEVERLSAFHDAVVTSRAWRLVQALRRPFGRAW